MNTTSLEDEKLLAKRARSKKYYQENKKKSLEVSKKYRESHRTEQINYLKEYRIKNKEILKQKRRDYIKRKPELIKKLARDFYYKNIEKERSIKRIRRHQRRQLISGSVENHSAGDIANLLISQKYECVGCRKDIKNYFEIDHIVPLIKGGSNGKDNIQLLCMPCNRSKGTKDNTEFMKLKGRIP